MASVRPLSRAASTRAALACSRAFSFATSMRIASSSAAARTCAAACSRCSRSACAFASATALAAAAAALRSSSARASSSASNASLAASARLRSFAAAACASASSLLSSPLSSSDCSAPSSEWLSARGRSSLQSPLWTALTSFPSSTPGVGSLSDTSKPKPRPSGSECPAACRAAFALSPSWRYFLLLMWLSHVAWDLKRFLVYSHTHAFSSGAAAWATGACTCGARGFGCAMYTLFMLNAASFSASCFASTSASCCSRSNSSAASAALRASRSTVSASICSLVLNSGFFLIASAPGSDRSRSLLILAEPFMRCTWRSGLGRALPVCLQRSDSFSLCVIRRFDSSPALFLAPSSFSSSLLTSPRLPFFFFTGTSQFGSSTGASILAPFLGAIADSPGAALDAALGPASFRDERRRF
mmetsp:Transcript_45257/g.75495  ORF Transcript_45257/g.75495 Transcript_45257/m.75495 type:complete len:415 (-) Transcript_45257:452-1696(-)